MATQAEPINVTIVPERIVPGRVPTYLFQKHAARYQFARQIIKGKEVLEIGSGDGYGAYYLVRHARRLVGIDHSQETIVQAYCRYRDPNLSFAVMTGESLSFPAEYFDVICMFEVFEHVSEVVKLLRESYRVLRAQGLFLVSTPNAASYVATGHNPWHTKEYTYREFYEVLSPYFPVVEIYGQICQRPLRRFLYHVSSHFYFNYRIFRYLLSSLGNSSVRYIGDRMNRNKIDWVESCKTGLFEFRLDHMERADSFLAVCRKEG